jgi:ATP-binding cassette, subfamily B, bacterial PglK
MSYYQSLKFLLGTERKKIFPITLLFLTSSMVDLLGIGFIGAYVAIIFDPMVVNKLGDYQMLNFLMQYNHGELILIIGYSLIAIFLVKFIFLLFCNYFIISFAAVEQAKVQKLLVNGMLHQSYENFLASNSGDNLSSLANFSGVYREVLQAILQIISNTLVIVAVCIFLGAASFITLLILVIFMGVIFGSYNFIFSKRIDDYGRDFMDGASSMIQGTTEVANGLKEIKTLGKERFFMKLVSDSADIVAKSSLKLNFLSTVPRNIIEVILIIFVVFIVYLNIDDTTNFASTLSMLGVFTAGMVRVAPLVSQLQISWNSVVYGESAITKLSKIIKDQTEEYQFAEASKNLSAVNESKNNIFTKLVLENISYNYPESDIQSIDNISFSVEKGDFIGLIGPSGAGKTSLVNIILGFMQVNSGSIKFNDQDIQTNINLWRTKCAYLPQDIFLINGSLKENITFERDSINNAKLITKAIELSKLSDFVESLPDGIETSVGDKGVRLSGGQRQRVAIARAIYHQRELLILDESTSALDAETEKNVMEELIGLRNEKTIIAIAHRISTLKECNKIFKLNAGKLEGPFSYTEIDDS